VSKVYKYENKLIIINVLLLKIRDIISNFTKCIYPTVSIKISHNPNIFRSNFKFQQIDTWEVVGKFTYFWVSKVITSVFKFVFDGIPPKKKNHYNNLFMGIYLPLKTRETELIYLWETLFNLFLKTFSTESGNCFDKIICSDKVWIQCK
jgi:hypothetical protein